MAAAAGLLACKSTRQRSKHTAVVVVGGGGGVKIYTVENAIEKREREKERG